MSLCVGLTIIALASTGTHCSRTSNALPVEIERAESRGTNVMTEENKITEPPKTMLILVRAFEVGKEKLNLHFELKNKSKDDIYVLDIFPIYDLETMKPSVRDLNNTVTVWDEADGVRLIRGLPPYPKEKSMSVFYTPYSSKIAPGNTLKRHLSCRSLCWNSILIILRLRETLMNP